MQIRMTDLELRQVILGGTALLLILVHMVAPGAGVDAVSVIILVFLAIVLYGDELTRWLGRLQERPVSQGASDVGERVRDVAYQVEHARVARNTDRMGDGQGVSETLEGILERAQGEPRAALLLTWGALEDRLRAVGDASDGVEGARKLAEQARVPRQFVDAYASFRSLRAELAQTADGEVSEDVLWSLVDVGGGLLALAPKE
jgi:hypothetical protein